MGSTPPTPKKDLIRDTIVEQQKKDFETREEAKKQAALKEALNKFTAEGRRKDADADATWENVVKESNRIISDSQKGFDNFNSGSASTFTHIQLIRDALAKSISPGSMLPTLKGLVTQVYYKKFRSNREFDPSESTPPKLQHFITFTDDDKLDVSSVSRNLRVGDGLKLSPDDKRKISEELAVGVTAWLDTHGYQADPSRPNVYVSKTDPTHQLTQAEFMQLRDGPKGLDAYLSSTYNLLLQQGLEDNRDPEPTAPTPS